ncbi:MAG: galactosyldiacylglycerol synthase [Kofleriaceae bacterium]
MTRIDTGNEIGTISDAQLKFLTDQLSNDDDEDHYVIDADTLELLSDNGAEPELLALLEKALDDDDSMDIAWE